MVALACVPASSTTRAATKIADTTAAPSIDGHTSVGSNGKTGPPVFNHPFFRESLRVRVVELCVGRLWGICSFVWVYAGVHCGCAGSRAARAQRHVAGAPAPCARKGMAIATVAWLAA